MPNQRACRAKDPIACRYHGRISNRLNTPMLAPRVRSSIPSHILHTGQGINAKFAFTNRIAGGYDRAKHLPIQNLTSASFAWTKPAGGLWIGTVGRGGLSSWDALILAGEEPAPDQIQRQIRFTPTARVLLIDSLADYRSLLDTYPHHVAHDKDVGAYIRDMAGLIGGGMSSINPDGTPKRGLDYEALARDYDALVLSQAGLYSCGRQDFGSHMDGDMSLYLWDIESGLVFNPDAILIT